MRTEEPVFRERTDWDKVPTPHKQESRESLATLTSTTRFSTPCQSTRNKPYSPEAR